MACLYPLNPLQQVQLMHESKGSFKEKELNSPVTFFLLHRGDTEKFRDGFIGVV